MFHDLTVSAVRPEGADAVAVSFAVPAPLARAFAFRPGQYLTLRAKVAGADIRRSYSIASAPGAPLTVGIRYVPGGAFSGFAQALRPGDVLQVMPPQGRFVAAGTEADLLLIAAGSGITPMVGIAAEALARGARVTLVYGNRDTAHIMFRETLEALKDRYLGRFTLVHVLSREVQDVALLNGRVDAARIMALARAGVIDPLAADGVFLCGPGGMIDAVSDTLVDAGLPADRLHLERFTVEGDTGRAPRSDLAEAAANRGVEVTVLLDGVQRRFHVGSQDGSVLEAAERAGLELPYSCRGGMCCTCRCKMTDGAAEMAVNYSLEPWEIAAGFVLACQARPTTARIALDFDAV